MVTVSTMALFINFLVPLIFAIGKVLLGHKIILWGNITHCLNILIHGYNLLKDIHHVTSTGFQSYKNLS